VVGGLPLETLLGAVKTSPSVAGHVADVEQNRPSFLRWLQEYLGLTSLTIPQKVWIAIAFDGAQPGDFPEEPVLPLSLSGIPGEEQPLTPRDVALFFTHGVEFILPSAIRTLAIIKGARLGGTWLCALYLLYAAIYVPLDKLQRNEQAFATIVCPSMLLSAQPMNYIWGACELLLERGKAVGRTFEAKGDGIHVARSNGQEVVVRPVAASSGGRNVRGVWHVAVLMDETSFFRDEKTGKVNDLEIWRAFRTRILASPVAKRMVISTAWLESGLLWDMHKRELAKPAPEYALPLTLPSLLMRHNDADLELDIKAEFEADRPNALREYCGVPLGQGAAFFIDRRAIESAMVAGEQRRNAFPVAPRFLERFTNKGAFNITAGADLAFRRNASALAIVAAYGAECELVALEEQLPGDKPLSPKQVSLDFGETMAQYGCLHVTSDLHGQDSLLDELSERGVEVHTVGPIDRLYGSLRSALHEGRLLLPRHALLARQLGELQATPRPGGKMSFKSPLWKDGRHGDLVSALAAAVWKLSTLQLEADAATLRGRRRFQNLPDIDWQTRLREQEQKEIKQDHEQTFANIDPFADPSQSIAGAPDWLSAGGAWD
jgi:hypothetical protein